MSVQIFQVRKIGEKLATLKWPHIKKYLMWGAKNWCGIITHNGYQLS